MYIKSQYLVKWLANESYWGGEFIETPLLKNQDFPPGNQEYPAGNPDYASGNSR